jgi:bacterial/archaeal transporter family-2 protein
MPALLAYALVIAAGISVAFQQVLNSSLRADLGSPWWAGVVSYLVGFAAITAATVAVEGPRLPAPSPSGT